MKADDILKYCLENLKGTVLINSWGERGVFYNPNNKLKRGIYILTIKEKDGENDKSSDLNRENIYRVNLGIRKNTFKKMFGSIPKRPDKGGIVNMNYDFSIIDRIVPHPVYAWMSWICILNPSEKTFEKLKPLIYEAYEYVKEKYAKKITINGKL
ncbi:hypothetical protein EII29_10340 [Leptotrichia sp. OH3620_COT-345]|uniref:DUF6194 family protein n=1 Tax=Leptotrichia sp. OH3620_COT-345 TaxID=2491048 RepID=UPI000F651B70|nr:DUF6194 family protein [Leptotrichia sp. OH3620_COT-345]RRD38431.1 hypothetical protein EII29_10340 [Leptotrichia sp. OH3620_COT-345]